MNSTRHETPDMVARVLLRHIPRSTVSVLDPCVGTGQLIKPLAGRSGTLHVTTIDVDAAVLEEVREAYRPVFGASLHLVNQDFLEWSSSKRRNRFDVVIMNPPFAAKKGEWVVIRRLPAKKSSERLVPMPIEAAFVLQAVRLLRPAGRLLAVLPPSIVAADSLLWLRKELMELGAIVSVHELPKRVFPRVESRMYLLVYERWKRRRILTLCNHDLLKPERLRCRLDELGDRLRFDFGYISARNGLSKIKECTSDLDWRPLGALADIFRGSADSPNGAKYAIHSRDYRDGFWRKTDRHRRFGHRVARILRRGDLLMRRVGRGCSQSVGVLSKHAAVACTDCVLVLRPKPKIATSTLLFCMRCILSSEGTMKLLERGTGAMYVTEESLAKLEVPFGLASRYPTQYERYVQSIRSLDIKGMENAEQRLMKLLISKLSQLHQRNVIAHRT